MKKNARFGTFTLDADFVSNDKNTLPIIMAACRIYRAEYLYHRNSIEYQAESEFFDVAEEGCKITEYEWLFDDSEDLERRVFSAKRIS